MAQRFSGWRWVGALLAVTLVAAGPPPDQPPPRTPKPADALLELLNGGGDPATLFGPDFLAANTPTHIREVAAQLSARFGRALSIRRVRMIDFVNADMLVTYERGSAHMDMALTNAGPTRIANLVLNGVASDEPSMAAVIETLRRLPGTTGLLYARLTPEGPQPLASLDPDRSLGVASAFKLAILAELVRATNAHERRWSDQVTLDGGPLPDGLYSNKPPGTEVTIRELAQKMISVSDNSATDILLALVGRQRIEAMLTTIGWHDVARNLPLLSVLDLFRLKAGWGGRLGDRWVTLDDAGRRAMLAGEVAATPPGAIDGAVFARNRPRHIEAIEWFASPADLARTLDWIWRHSEGGPGAEARAILAINPGVGRSGDGLAYIGYKGGSEIGVVSMNFLIRRRGEWLVLSAIWNDPAAAVDEQRFVALMGRAVALIGQP